ncbi:MAG: transcriptional regulator [Bacteroidales bacterium]|nr:transcriptional regulator [Bacteroidales bacterium]
MPRTTCKITSEGQEAFRNYVEALKEYLSEGSAWAQPTPKEAASADTWQA